VAGQQQTLLPSGDLASLIRSSLPRRNDSGVATVGRPQRGEKNLETQPRFTIYRRREIPEREGEGTLNPAAVEGEKKSLGELKGL